MGLFVRFTSRCCVCNSVSMYGINRATCTENAASWASVLRTPKQLVSKVVSMLGIRFHDKLDGEKRVI